MCSVFVRNIFLLYLLNNCLITDTIFNELQSNGFMKGERSFELYSLPVFVFVHFLISNLPRPPSEHTSWMAPTTSPIYNWQGASQTKKKSKNKINSSGTEIPSNKTHLFHNFYGFLDYKNRISSLWVNLNVSMFLLISA